MSTFAFDSGSAVELEPVRELFQECRYTVEGVCERTGVSEIYQFLPIARGRETALETDDALDVLIRLFLDGYPVSIAKAKELLPSRGLQTLLDLDLIDVHPRDPDSYAANVQLYPTESLYVASDLDTLAPGRADLAELEPADHVFSAITTLTGNFVGQLPTTPCDRFLEMCAGTGIAALIAARFSNQVWSLDITERATKCASFNARLNGLENFTALQGNLYEPVAGMTFDRIAAHPPYVPANETRFIFRDAGEDGEEILRPLLAGVPDYLAPGGHFYCTCNGTDREGAPLETRIREMVGPANEEFDLLLIVHYEMHPTEMYCRHAAVGRVSFAVAEQRHNLYRSLHAERIVYCSMVLQRHDTPRKPFTIRRERAVSSTGEDTDRLLHWATAAVQDGFLERILDSRPVLSPHARLEVTHQPEGGEWTVSRCRVRSESPFLRTVNVSLNVASLLAACDGTATTRELHHRVVRQGDAGGVPEEAFAEWVREMTTEGILQVDLDAAAPRDVPTLQMTS